MKVTIQFNPSDENDDGYSMYNALNANKMARALHEIRNLARNYSKYREFETEEAEKVIDELYESICEEIGFLLEE